MTILPISLEGYSGTRVHALSQALADAISGGVLPPGTRLPTHRQLAEDLDLAVATVSKAYAALAQRNLVSGEVGRGTFVIGPPSRLTIKEQPDGKLSHAIDLRLNQPPVLGQDDVMTRYLGEDGMARDLGMMARCCVLHTGTEEQRVAGAHWLRRTWPDVKDESVVVTMGAHTAIGVALITAASAGDTVICDPLTYFGAVQLAKNFGQTVRTVPCDIEGMVPEALEDAARRWQPKAVFLMPTNHNPLTTDMTERRKDAIADVCARYNIAVIEDEVFADLREKPLSTIAERIPDLTFLLTSLSKSFAPGLRAGFLASPHQYRRQVDAQVQSLLLTTLAPLSIGLAARLIVSGEAEKFCGKIRDELSARNAMVRKLLPGAKIEGSPSSHHIWLPFADSQAVSDVALRLAERDILVATSSDFAAGRENENQGLRVSLGAADSREDLARFCSTYADIMHVGGQRLARAV